MREAHTAILERGTEWRGTVATEPYEAGWASEAVVFVRALEASNVPDGTEATVEISPDGLNWVPEGTRVKVPTAAGEMTFGRLANFGHFLRLRAILPPDAACKVMVALALKG